MARRGRALLHHFPLQNHEQRVGEGAHRPCRCARHTLQTHLKRMPLALPQDLGQRVRQFLQRATVPCVDRVIAHLAHA
jgi:hypothetical protein